MDDAIANQPGAFWGELLCTFGAPESPGFLLWNSGVRTGSEKPATCSLP